MIRLIGIILAIVGVAQLFILQQRKYHKLYMCAFGLWEYYHDEHCVAPYPHIDSSDCLYPLPEELK